MNHRINDHLIAALRELATAQVLADAETSRSYCRDIPSGHAIRYAAHHVRAHDLQFIRAQLRALVDHPDEVRGAGCDLVQPGRSGADPIDAAA